MIQLTQVGSTTGSILRKHCRRQAAVLAPVIVCVLAILCSQKAGASDIQSKASLVEALKRADTGTQLNIFYVHGIGIDPPNVNASPQNFEVSQEFRTSLCRLVDCTSKLVGRNYADKDLFKLNARPTLIYLGEDVWKTNEDWNAAAPFVDHYNLVRKNGTTIYLHEINWWPLVLSAKCRQIIATDAALVDRDQKHTAICSAQTIPDQGGRYKSYAWITKDEVQTRKAPWPKAAVINRWLKHDILDWGFADALLAVGPLHEYFIEGIREVILESFTPAENQEFIIVSHSLGSYLMFSALDLRSEAKASTLAPKAGWPAGTSEPQSGLIASMIEEWKKRFDDVLRKTSHAYFMANQLSLLELANIDETKGGSLITHLKAWGDRRAEAQARAHIVAFSDPDDLLTWQVPDKGDMYGNSVTVTNLPAKNARRWFWLFANPESAHTAYDKNKRVVRAMVPKADLRSTQ